MPDPAQEFALDSLASIPTAGQFGSDAFRRLLDALPVAAYTCDLAGQITYFNSAAVQMWGRAPALNDVGDLYCGSFRLYSASGVPISHANCWMALALRERQSYRGEEIIVERPDGERLNVLAHAHPVLDDAGTLVGAVNILIDISERKRAELAQTRMANDLAQLHQMSTRLSSTLELQPLLDETLRTASSVVGTDRGILALCDADGKHLLVGASLGYDEAFLAKVQKVAIGVGASGACLQNQERVIIEDVLADPRTAAFGDPASEGGFRAVYCTPLITRSGATIGVLSLHFGQAKRPSDREIHLIDLYARQAVDFIENARLYKQMRDADRRKDEFLAMLAHELRNPLAPLCNSLQLLRLQEDLPTAVLHVREIMERQVGQMVRLVDDLLEVSRITRGKIELRKESVELSSIVASAVETSRPLIDAAGHQLAISLPREVITLNADPVRLAQVISNLLNNAAKYTDAGGQIWLSARCEGTEAVVSVRDTGIGIPDSVLPRIFDMFTQVDSKLSRTQGGLGIGLTLAQSFVQLHGGTIVATSDGPGQGSEFTIRLPVERVEEHCPPLHGNSPSQAALGKRRIVVVDDTRAAGYILGKLLEAMGQEVRTFEDPLTAIDEILRDPPDVVISDIAMPHMDGYELARRLREEASLARVTIIALTGYGQDSDRQQALEAGFDHHLVKPVGYDDLQNLLQTVAAASLALRR